MTKITKTELTKAISESDALDLEELCDRAKGRELKARLIASFAHVGVFANEFLPEYISHSWGAHHDPLFRVLPRGAIGSQINVLAPRGAAKSTIMAVMYPLHAIFFKSLYELLDLEPYHFIVIASRSHTMAKSRVQDIKRKIEIDPNFHHLKGELNWGEERIITSNNTLIVPKGRGGQIRGSLFGAYRPDLIISDDLDDPETVFNPDVRSKDQLWFDSDFLRAGRPDGKTNFINIDTLKHEEATASLLRDRSGWNTMFFRAIEDPADLWHPEREDLWKEWERIYTDMRLEANERHEKATEFYNLNKAIMHGDNITELWPEAIDYLKVRKEICDVGYFPVMRELQNSTRDPSRALFDMDNALTFDVVEEGFLRSDNALVTWDEMTGGTVFLDWAGGKDVVENAFAAVVGVVWIKLPGARTEQMDSIMDGVHGYVFAADIRRIGIDDQIKASLDMYRTLKAGVKPRNFRIRLGIEGFIQDTWQAQKQVTQRVFNLEKDRRGMNGLPIEWLQRRTNKFDRIDALQPLIRNGWLLFNKSLPNEFWKQMSLYPTGDFVDAPDALEGACQLRVSKFEDEREDRRIRLNLERDNFRLEI